MTKELKPVTIEEIVARWSAPDARPLARGCLIAYSEDEHDTSPPCYCAQGDILHVAGYSDGELTLMEQPSADREVARLLDIPVAQAVLLRNINDGDVRYLRSPQDVLGAPERVIGPLAKRVLAFYRRIDALTDEELLTSCAEAPTSEVRHARPSSSSRMGAALVAGHVWRSKVKSRTGLSLIWHSGLLATDRAEGAVIEIMTEPDTLYSLPFFGINALSDLGEKP